MPQIFKYSHVPNTRKTANCLGTSLEWILCLLLTFCVTKQKPKYIFFLLSGSVIKITYTKSRREGEKSLMDKLNPIQIFIASTTNWIFPESEQIELFMRPKLSQYICILTRFFLMVCMVQNMWYN